MAKFLSFIFQGVLSFCLFLIVMLLIFIGTTIGTFNFWFPSVSNWYLKSKTGFEVNIDKSECSLFKGILDFKGIHLLNPDQSFELPKFVNVDSAYVNLNLMSLLKREVVIDKISIKIDDVTIIQNQADQINAIEFKNAVQNLIAANISRQPSQQQTHNFQTKYNTYKSTNKPANEQSKSLQIKTLDVALNQVELINILPGNEDKIVNVQYEKTFTNVSDINDIVNTLVKDMKKFGLSYIFNLATGYCADLKPIKEITETYNNTSDKISKFSNQVNHVINSISSTINPTNNNRMSNKSSIAPANNKYQQQYNTTTNSSNSNTRYNDHTANNSKNYNTQTYSPNSTQQIQTNTNKSSKQTGLDMMKAFSNMIANFAQDDDE